MLNFLFLLLAGLVVSILLSHYERNKRRKYCYENFDMEYFYKSIIENNTYNISYDDFVWAWRKIANTLHIEADCLDPTKKVSEYSTHLPFMINSDMEEIERMLNKIATYKELEVDDSGFYKDFTISDIVCLVAQDKNPHENKNLGDNNSQNLTK